MFGHSLIADGSVIGLFNQVLPVPQLADAQQDVLSRLSPSVQSFFAKRAAAKQSTQVSAPPAATADATSKPITKEAPSRPGMPKETAASAPATAALFRKVSARAASAQPPAKQPLLKPEHQSSSLVSRLRFSLDGEVVEIKPNMTGTANHTAKQQVVQRDILRYVVLSPHKCWAKPHLQGCVICLMCAAVCDHKRACAQLSYSCCSNC